MGLKLEMLKSRSNEMFGKLHVHIKKASRLPNMAVNTSMDSFVKIFLLPYKSSKAMKKTEIITNNHDPVWDEKFEYNKFTIEELSSKQALELTVWDSASKFSNKFVGGIRIGPSPLTNLKESTQKEVGHWEEMLKRPGEWVERNHALMPTMNCRPRAESLLQPTVVIANESSQS